MIKVLQTIIISTGLIAAFALQAAQNGIYRWTDEQGVVQYSDIPPDGVEAVFIKTSTGRSAPPPTPEPEQEATASSEDNGSKTLEIMPEKDPALCKQAQNNLKALEGARIRITEPDGTKRILSEDEREFQRENARKFIKVHC